ncbi:hypothetical protein P1P75_01015 [Streptomyces sp. ID05-39B]|uniref:hypothetical protein n=1 Tax=Streptomyces sp. ID05-39B TaxID=3028664 RepID=UPI0029AE97B4|nr:hypothetical protein [Streptomyces sp. ID05-39B]MDX3525069.1 hypothetical protein [Streptomyces sp. ID05-39B]
MATTYYPYDNGTVGPTGPEGPAGPAGAAGAPGVVQSVNGKSSAAVVLDAADVNALPDAGNAQLDGQYLSLNTAAGTVRAFTWKTAGVDRWQAQADELAETGSAAGSNFRLTARNDDGSFNKTVIYARRDTGQIAFNTTAPHGSADVTSAGAIGIKDQAGDPATVSGGSFLYSKSGVPYIKRADGTSFQIVSGIEWSNRGAANGVASLDASVKVPITQLPDPSIPSGFTPESLGLKAWAGDPDFCASGFSYTGVGTGRMSAVYVNRTMTVSKIVWHVFSYGGGLLAGSWAGIYDGTGARVGYTGDMSTATYEPAEQAAAGGGWSSSDLTAPVTLTPGVYYVLWRWNYTASPVDGPGLARYESASTCQSVMGLGTTIWRHGSYSTTATTAPTSVTVSSFQRDPIRFWVALA